MQVEGVVQRGHVERTYLHEVEAEQRDLDECDDLLCHAIVTVRQNISCLLTLVNENDQRNRSAEIGNGGRAETKRRANLWVIEVTLLSS